MHKCCSFYFRINVLRYRMETCSYNIKSNVLDGKGSQWNVIKWQKQTRFQDRIPPYLEYQIPLKTLTTIYAIFSIINIYWFFNEFFFIHLYHSYKDGNDFCFYLVRWWKCDEQKDRKFLLLLSSDKTRMKARQYEEDEGEEDHQNEHTRFLWLLMHISSSLKW